MMAWLTFRVNRRRDADEFARQGEGLSFAA